MYPATNTSADISASEIQTSSHSGNADEKAEKSAL